MEPTINSIRPFLGARDFAVSRKFYATLGFQEVSLSPTLSLLHTGAFGFYLQDAYVRDWVDNTMIFLEVADVDRYWQQLAALKLPAAFPGVKLLPVKSLSWGKECFLHDPSGILWHIGEFAG